MRILVLPGYESIILIGMRVRDELHPGNGGIHQQENAKRWLVDEFPNNEYASGKANVRVELVQAEPDRLVSEPLRSKRPLDREGGRQKDVQDHNARQEGELIPSGKGESFHVGPELSQDQTMTPHAVEKDAKVADDQQDHGQIEKASVVGRRRFVAQDGRCRSSMHGFGRGVSQVDLFGIPRFGLGAEQIGFGQLGIGRAAQHAGPSFFDPLVGSDEERGKSPPFDVRHVLDHFQLLLPSALLFPIAACFFPLEGLRFAIGAGLGHQPDPLRLLGQGRRRKSKERHDGFLRRRFVRFGGVGRIGAVVNGKDEEVGPRLVQRRILALVALAGRRVLPVPLPTFVSDRAPAEGYVGTGKVLQMRVKVSDAAPIQLDESERPLAAGESDGPILPLEQIAALAGRRQDFRGQEAVLSQRRRRRAAVVVLSFRSVLGQQFMQPREFLLEFPRPRFESQNLL